MPASRNSNLDAMKNYRLSSGTSGLLSTRLSDAGMSSGSGLLSHRLSDTGMSEFANDTYDDYKYVVGNAGNRRRSSQGIDGSNSFGVGFSGHVLHDMSVTSLGSITDFNDISESADTETASFAGNNNANQYILQQARVRQRSTRGEDETLVQPSVQQSSFRQSSS